MDVKRTTFLTLLFLLLTASPKTAEATSAPGSLISGQDLKLMANTALCAASLGTSRRANLEHPGPRFRSFAKTVATVVTGRVVKAKQALALVSKGALGLAALPCAGTWDRGLSWVTASRNADNSKSSSLTDEQFQELKELSIAAGDEARAELLARLVTHRDHAYKQFGQPDDGLGDANGPGSSHATSEGPEEGVGSELSAAASREGLHEGGWEVQKGRSCHLVAPMLAPERRFPRGSAGHPSVPGVVRAVAPAVGRGRERGRRPQCARASLC